MADDTQQVTDASVDAGQVDQGTDTGTGDDQQRQLSRREMLSEALNASDGEGERTPAQAAAEQRARDESGKFTKGVKAQVGNQQSAQRQTQQQQAAPQRAARPQSWKKEYEEHWGRLDPQLQAYIAEREGQFAEGVSAYKQEWDRVKPILDVIAPFQKFWDQHNVQPHQWIQSLGNAHQALVMGNPQQKVAAIMRLAQSSGIHPQMLVAAMTGQQMPPGTMQDPTIQALARGFGQVRNEVTALRSQQEQQVAARIASEVDAFGKDRPHFNEVRATMGDLIEKGVAQDLQTAYDIALRMPQHDNIRQAIEQERAASEQRTRIQQAQRAKAQAVSPRSATPANAAKNTPQSGSRREQLSSAFDEVAGGRV